MLSTSDKICLKIGTLHTKEACEEAEKLLGEAITLLLAKNNDYNDLDKLATARGLMQYCFGELKRCHEIVLKN